MVGLACCAVSPVLDILFSYSPLVWFALGAGLLMLTMGLVLQGVGWLRNVIRR